MSLRGRIAAVASIAVALAVIGAALGIYLAVGSELRGQIDSSLRERARGYLTGGHGGPPSVPGSEGATGSPGAGTQGTGPPGGIETGLPGLSAGAPPAGGPPGYGGRLAKRVSPAPYGGASGYLEFLSASGTVTVPGGQGSTVAREITPDKRDKQIAERGRGETFSDRTVKGIALRVLTRGIGPSGALIVTRPLTEVNSALGRILLILIIVGACGIALAALLGTLVARTALAPIVRFTRRTEQLTDSLDASQRLEVHGRDELARLAGSFNATLAALERSVETQRQLITDASHELRTPMAALRANIQILGEAHRLSPSDQESLRRDIVQELDELTALVADVVELARGAREKRSHGEAVQLEEIVGEAVERARRRGTLELRADLEPAVVQGDPDQIGRAVTNLLENARKWSQPDGLVEVELRAGTITVRDHGAGFSEVDLPRVFERFYRAANARGLPGSGLGLAIVRQTAEAHGGFVRAANAPEGGAIVEIGFGPVIQGANGAASEPADAADQAALVARRADP